MTCDRNTDSFRQYYWEKCPMQLFVMKFQFGTFLNITIIRFKAGVTQYVQFLIYSN